LYEGVYPRLDVLLSFSPNEGWPLAIAEAMAHGVVPVCAEFTGIHAEGIVRHEETGLIFPVGDVTAAAAELRRLWRSQRLLQRLGRQAASEVVEQYSPGRFGAGWDRALRSCLERPAIRLAGRTTHPRQDVPRRRPARRVERMRMGKEGFDTARAEWPTLTAEERVIRVAELALHVTHTRPLPSASTRVRRAFRGRFSTELRRKSTSSRGVQVS
jgi:hypothetical protein